MPLLRSLLTAGLFAASSALPWQMERTGGGRPTTLASQNNGDPAPWLNPHPEPFVYSQQKLDHFDPTNQQVFSQRYWLINDFFRDPKGPVIISWCGEYECPPIIPGRLFFSQMAYELGALVIIPEMRYYGLSQPFPGNEPQSTANLRFLSSKQHIEDVAQLALEVQRQINANYSLPADYRSQFLSMGGSYPGALSAWFRLKHPEIVVGSLASSGVINAFVNMPQFDEQLQTDAGPACANALANVTKTIERLLPQGQIKAQFGPDAAALSDDDFLWFIADTGAESAQYGHRDLLCSSVGNANDPLPGFINYTVSFFVNTLGNDPSGYNSDLLALPNAGDGRSWTYQVCSEFGWLNTAPLPPAFSIRSQRVNLEYFLGLCKKLFPGTPLPPAWPDVNATNAYYGGANFGGSNVYFSNGGGDPWKWASLTPNTTQPSLDPSNTVAEIPCATNCHCVDLYTPASTDSPQLVASREAFKAAVQQWLGSEEGN